MEELISKKDLLLETNISYGQLYRWKRKGLIPEAWFMRRSTFTGQETFFPRDAMLERIRWIQGAKSEAALDELAEEIKNPAKWAGRLPADVISRVWDRAIPGGASDISRVELFAAVIGEHERMSPGGTEQLGEFLRDIPGHWLDEPSAWLAGWSLGPKWQFIVAERKDGVWWGGGELPLAVTLTPWVKEVDRMFEEAMRLQFSGKGQGR